MAKKKYDRRKEDRNKKWSLFPDWMVFLSSASKLFLVLVPVLISGLGMYRSDELIWTCVWCLSMVTFINYTEK